MHEIFRRNRQAERADQWTAFEAEAMPYLGELFRVAMWLTHDRAEAEDLVQETFTQALESFHRYEQGTNCRAWLVKIMYHMRSNRRRASARLQLVSDIDERIAETVAFEPPTPQGITEEEVLRALKCLPQQYLEVVVLSDVEDLTYKEIAEALLIPVGTVMSRLHRGRKLLRMELANYANSHGIKQSVRPGLPKRAERDYESIASDSTHQQFAANSG
ncbi:MAG: sigma-70 family RNA polymerase sigma factor [Blastocatellia bacterium]